MTAEKKTPRPLQGRGVKGDKPEETLGVDSKAPRSASIAANEPNMSAEDYRAVALDYAARGWSVFPCKRGNESKKPDTGLGGFHNGTRDPVQIGLWWPDGVEPRNIGGVPPAGTFVIDVDLYKPEANDALRAFAKALNATGAPLQVTGNRGVHFHFMGDPPEQTVLRQKVGCIALEVKAQNGYLVLPPSIHPDTGRRYAWRRPPDSVIALPPLPMGYRLTRQRGSGVSDKKRLGLSIADMKECFESIPPKEFLTYGQWFLQVAAINHESGGSDEGLELAEALSTPGRDSAANKWPTLGNYTGEVVTMATFVRMAERYGYRSPATAERAMAEFVAGTFLADTLAMHFDHENEPPSPPFSFKGVFPLGKVSILAGTGGAGKSYLALSLGAHYVARKAFGAWFVPDHHGQTDSEALLLFAEEDRADINWRYFHAMAGAGFSDDEVKTIRRRMHMKSLLDLRASSALAEYSPDNRREGALLMTLRRVLLGRPMIRFVMLDPMLVLHKLEENDNGGMAQLMLMLAAVAHECGCTIVLTHHFSKQGAKADELNEMSLRGASSITAEARAVVVIRGFDRDDVGVLQNVLPDELERVIEVRLPKHNYSGPRAPYFLRAGAHGEVEPMHPQPIRRSAAEARQEAQDATAQARERSAIERDATIRSQVLDLVGEEPDITSTAIYASKAVTGSRTTIEPVLKQAVRDGLIGTTEGKRGALHHTLTSRGRAARKAS